MLQPINSLYCTSILQDTSALRSASLQAIFATWNLPHCSLSCGKLLLCNNLKNMINVCLNTGPDYSSGTTFWLTGISDTVFCIFKWKLEYFLSPRHNHLVLQNTELSRWMMIMCWRVALVRDGQGHDCYDVLHSQSISHLTPLQWLLQLLGSLHSCIST